MNDVIVGMGEVLWDMLPKGKKIGGAPANFAYHVSQYGFDGCVVSAVGDDKLGNEILESFNNRRLNYLIQRVPYPTGTVQIELDEAGIPCYEIKENVAWDNIPFTVDLEKLAKKTRAVCFGSLAQRNTVSRETINRFLDVMSDAAGQYRVFDVNLRQGFYDKEILCNSMKRCNILKINDEELIAVSRMFEYPGINLEDKCRALLSEYGLEILILQRILFCIKIMIFRIGIIQFLNLQTFCQCRFHISDMSQCIGADDTVCHYSAAGILQCNDFAAQHIGFHLIPDSAAATALCDGDTAHIHTGTAVQVCNFHIIIADGL